jgi:sn-glycerol 3-phosphate transport system substrate-binding protein
MTKSSRVAPILWLFFCTGLGFNSDVLGVTGLTKAQSTKNLVAKSPDVAPDLEFAHSLGVASEARLQILVDRFNGQSSSKIRLVHLESSGKPKPLNLATPSVVAQFIAQKSSFKPIYQALGESGQTLDTKLLSPDLLVAELGGGKQPLALPLAFSTPVLFYDKAAFAKAGLDPESPPNTWQEMQVVAGKLADAGHRCPYTTSWPTWVHIDNMSALAGEPVANKQKELGFNGLPQVRHVARLSAWFKADYFKIFGSRDEADLHFAKRECAMLTSNSWIQSWLRDVPGLELGIAPLPHDEDVYGGRRHTLVDGSSLWVGSGYSKQEYQTVAKFVKFLLAPDIQIEIARVGNFIPLTKTARSALQSRLFRDEQKTQTVIASSLNGQGAGQGIPLGSIEPVRAIIEEELNAVWANVKPAKAALDDAVFRSNALLNRLPALKKGLLF